MNVNGKAVSDAAAQTEALLMELWQRNLHIFIDRLSILDRAAAAASAGTITLDDRDEAASVSHKLAGSLGMFGYHRGSEIGRELEQLFRSLPGTKCERICPLTRELRQITLPFS